MELLTERLQIREFNEDDWEAVHAYGSDPEVVRYMPWGPSTKEETREFIRRAMAQQEEALR